MAYIREKIKKGNPYYYIVEGRRVDGKVKQTILEYIGPLEKLKQIALEAYRARSAASNDSDNKQADVESADLSFRAYRHGAVMGILWTARQLGIEQMMDEVFPPKTVKGLPRSRVLLLAMIQRAVEPGSKREFASWCRNTSLPYHLQFNADDLDSAAFWEAMDGIDENLVSEMWGLLIKKLIETYHVDLRKFHLDYSNYFTFINTKNGRCFICKRGHNKQKRDDLLQFSLAALTTSALNVPISWQLYKGNVNDKAEFPVFTAYIREQLTKLDIPLSEVTVCFDGGSNSEENFKGLGFHFVCANSLVGHKYLYDIDLSEYKKVTLANGHERNAYFIKEFDFSGVHGSGVLEYSEDLKEGQVAQMDRDIQATAEIVKETIEKLNNPRSGIYTQLRKREEVVRHEQRDVSEYNAKIEKEEKERELKGTKKRGRAKKRKEVPTWNPEEEIEEIARKMVFSKHKYLTSFSLIELLRKADGKYDISWKIDELAKEGYIRKYYGKKLICTDHTDWSMLDILNEYTDQECIENGIFRASKDTDHFAIRPQYHWTDEKIRVHVFICLAALTIGEVLRTHFENNGIKIPKSRLLDRLDEIHDGWIFLGDKKVRRVLEKLDDEHKQYWTVLESVQNGLKTESEMENEETQT